MKKLGLLIAGMMVAGSWVHAQTNQVLSRNAVGYVKVSVPTNGSRLAMTRIDFENLDGANFTVTNTIGNQLPVGSSVYIWDAQQSAYKTENKQRSGWNPGTNRIVRGAGMFLQLPVGTAPTNVFLMGEVPDDSTAPSTTVTSVSVDMLGYPYPVSMPITNINIIKSAVVGDAVHLWSSTGQTYVTYNRQRSGWSPSSFTNVILQPGEAFWYANGTFSTQTWTEVKPYTWP